MKKTTLLLVSSLGLPLSLAAGQGRWPADQFSSQLVPGKVLPAESCRTTTPALTSDSLGPLRPGMTLAELLRACPRPYYGWHFEEGIAEPGLAIRLGRVLALTMLRDTLGSKAVAYRILIADTSARTIEGLGPGSRLTEMIAAWGPPHIDAAECSLYAWFSTRAHLSWIMEFPRGWDCSHLERFVTDSAPSRLPGTLRAGLAILSQ